MLSNYYYHLTEKKLNPFSPKNEEQNPSAGLYWYDLYLPSDDEYQFLNDMLSITIPTREEMEEIETSSRLYHEDGAQFMTITVLSDLEGEEPKSAPMTFILKDHILITLRYSEPKTFCQFRDNLLKASFKTDDAFLSSQAETLLLSLLEAFLDRLSNALSLAGQDIDKISKLIFRSKVKKSNKKSHNLQNLLEQIGSKGDLMTQVGDSLLSISRLLSYHHVRAHYKDNVQGLNQDAVSLIEHTNLLSNRISFLLDATLGLINLEQNQIIKIFSIAAVVFLPPTLVASIYGMNFKFIPELEWVYGYPAALLIMILAAFLPLVYFKKKGWL
jgi:magnesium transporter